MYNYQNSPHAHRRMRGVYGFPWLLAFVMLLGFHNMASFFVTFALIMFFGFIFRAVISATSNTGANLKNYQAQQPYIYKSPYQSSYQPYEQGYQAPQEMYAEERPPVQGAYDQYEQPQAQYPEQLPPMQQ